MQTEGTVGRMTRPCGSPHSLRRAPKQRRRRGHSCYNLHDAVTVSCVSSVRARGARETRLSASCKFVTDSLRQTRVCFPRDSVEGYHYAPPPPPLVSSFGAFFTRAFSTIPRIQPAASPVESSSRFSTSARLFFHRRFLAGEFS